MNLITAGVTSAILVAGVAGSVTAYRLQAAPTEEVASVSPKPAEPKTRVQWAPCEEPSQLENDVCVTDVVRTVMRPASPASRPASSGYSAGTAVRPHVAAAPARAVAAYKPNGLEREDRDDDAYEDRDDDAYEDRDDDAYEDRDEDSEGHDEDSEDREGEDSEDHADEDSEGHDEDSEDHEDEDSEDHADED